VRGHTLDQLERPLPFARLLQIAVDLSRALAAAHRAGVLHRDIKPQNAIVAEDGCAKLLDFGLAALLEPRQDAAEPRARGGGIVGTPYYIAPEVWRAEAASRRSDVYSLGAVLYELAVGRAPHAGTPLEELPQVVQVRDAPAMEEASGDADPRFAAILASCLARDPAARYASGDQLRAALEHLAQSSAGVAIPAGNPYRG